MEELRTVALKTTAYEIRAIFAEGQTLFSVTDLCTASGMVNPQRWMHKNIITHNPEIQIRKISAPVKPDIMRTLPMYFTDRKSAEKMLSLVSSNEEMKKEIQKRILSFRFPQEADTSQRVEKIGEQAANLIGLVSDLGEQKKPIQKYNNSTSLSIDQHIDQIIYSLLDLKRRLSQI